ILSHSSLMNRCLVRGVFESADRLQHAAARKSTAGPGRRFFSKFGARKSPRWGNMIGPDAERGAPMSVPTRATLLEKVKNTADAGAWGRFLLAYQEMVEAWCLRRGLPDPHEAADAILDELRQRLQSFDYDPKKGRFRGWLYFFVLSKAEDFRRRMHQTP